MSGDLARIEEVVSAVLDPELPVVTIHDLGILRGVQRGADGTVEVTVTPTYSGCPALAAIGADILGALAAAGYARARVITVLSPAWSTDWITAHGRQLLAEHGIAPPGPAGPVGGPAALRLSVRCPQCGSCETREVSRFGSTACKALYVCQDCLEPFDAMKAL